MYIAEFREWLVIPFLLHQFLSGHFLILCFLLFSLQGDDAAFLYESQVKIFRDFLLRANKYGSLQMAPGASTPSRRILLVEVREFFIFWQLFGVQHLMPTVCVYVFAFMLFSLSDGDFIEVHCQ